MRSGEVESEYSKIYSEIGVGGVNKVIGNKKITKIKKMIGCKQDLFT